MEFSKVPPSGSFRGVVSSETAQSEFGASFYLRLLPPYRGEVKILTPVKTDRDYGDELQIDGVQMQERNPFTITYRAGRVEKVGEGRGSALRAHLLSYKKKIASVAQEYFTSRESSLLNGMIIGKTQDFDSALKIEMARSGTTHLVALSGYNVGILIWTIGFIASRFLSRLKSALASLFGILLFILITGGEASIIRAGIMAGFVVLVGLAGRPQSAASAILLSAVLMALFDPRIVHFNVGFQLSFLSLAGMIYLSPVLQNIFRLKISAVSGLARILGENLITTIAAQLGVLPLLLAYFGQFSVLAIFPNILILGLTPLTMFLGFCIAIGGLFFKFFPILFILPTTLLLRFELSIIHIFSRVVIPIPAWLFSSTLSIVFYYSVLISAIFIYKIPLKKHGSE